MLDPVSGAGSFAFDNIAGTSLSIYGTRTVGLLSIGNIAFTGVSRFAPIPPPAAVPLVVTGLAALSLLKRRAAWFKNEDAGNGIRLC